jgi:basic amino acid/polyamine antiporter, APA family
LIRAIRRWELAGLMLNTVIGASVFGVPSLLAAHLGGWSPMAFLIAGVGVGTVAACLAEVASQFRDAGGPYLYARTCFGPLAALQIGWLNWLSRTLAAAAAADLFVSYLIHFYPAAESRIIRALALALLIGFFAAVNYRGVRIGAHLSDFFAITKVSLLVFFVLAGLVVLAMRSAVRVTPAPMTLGPGNWLDAILLLVNTYGGFEAAFLVAGEARNPRKDAPIALLIAMATSTSLYIALQFVVMHTLPMAATSVRPVADSAAHFLGRFGSSLMASAALISVFGYLSAVMLHTPRLTFAMAEQGDFPRTLAAIHPRFRTPHVSILAFALLLLTFSVLGTFQWNVTLSAVSRLFIYASIAVALPVLRRQQPQANAFRLRGAMFFVVLALLFTGILVTTIRWSGFAVLAATSALAFLNWLRVRS